MRTDTTFGARSSGSVSPSLTLEGFAAAASRAGGVKLRDLTAFDCLEIWTRNSRYRITVLDPVDARVLIEGGAFFPTPAEAILSGASAGGSMLKLGWILDGFRLEILHEGQRIITTRVRTIRLNSPDALPGPF